LVEAIERNLIDAKNNLIASLGTGNTLVILKEIIGLIIKYKQGNR